MAEKEMKMEAGVVQQLIELFGDDEVERFSSSSSSSSLSNKSKHRRNSLHPKPMIKKPKFRSIHSLYLSTHPIWLYMIMAWDEWWSFLHYKTTDQMISTLSVKVSHGRSYNIMWMHSIQPLMYIFSLSLELILQFPLTHTIHFRY